MVDDEPAAEEPTGPVFVPSASMFTRFEAREKYQRVGLADTDAIRYRARLGLAVANIDVGGGKEVVVRFVPQATGFWEAGGDTLDDPVLGLHEGVLELHDGGHRLEVGRFEMVYGEHFAIGNVDWHHTGRAFDGVRAHIAPPEQGYYIDAFVTLLSEGSMLDPVGATRGDIASAIAAYDASGMVPSAPAAEQNPFGAGDHYFVGLYSGIGHAIAPTLDWDFYLLGQIAPVSTDPATGASVPESLRGTLGTRVKDKTGIVDYRLEAGVQVGDERDVSVFAYQGDLEVGVSGGGFRGALEGFYASGNDPDSADKNEGWNQLYPTAHKWLGYSDIMGGRSNVAGGVAHLSHATTEDLKLSLDAHMFIRPQPSMAGGPDGYTATELDFGALYAVGKGVGLRGGYALFLPDEDLYGASKPVHFVEIELRFDLK